MKKFAICVAAAALSPSATFAGDAGGWGFGITHGLDSGFSAISNTDNRILVPIQLGNGLWLEPFFGFASVELESGTSTTKFDAYDLGVGLFQTVKSTETTNFYWGGRVFYGKSEIDMGGPSDTEFDYFGVAPTIGATFSMAPNFQVGIEAFLRYVDGEDGLGSVTDDFESLDTGTNLTFRYFCQ